MYINRPPRSTVFRVLWARLKEHPLSRVGPGLITGVADDDPSGIATYSQAGAQFGLNMLWTMVLAFPLMAAIQSMCANISRVTGKGLAANIKTAFPPAVLQGRTLTTCGEYAQHRSIRSCYGGSSGTRHGVQPPPHDGRLCVRDASTAGICTLSPLRLFPEVADGLPACLRRCSVHGSRPLGPGLVAHGLAAFHAQFCRCRSSRRGLRNDHQPVSLFFWQASEEVEDMLAKKGMPLVRDAHAAGTELRRIRWDTWSGMLYSDITAYFIILATAVTLHVAGVTDRGYRQGLPTGVTDRGYRHQYSGAGGQRASAARR
jgi:hypothetical protein